MNKIIIEPGEHIEYGVSTPRYRVQRPVPGGYAYWNVIDTSEPNLPSASIPKGFTGAERLAISMCRDLNRWATTGYVPGE